MNTFKKIFFGIIAILSFSTMIVLLLLDNNRFFIFVEDLFSCIPSVFQINICDLNQKVENRRNKIIEKMYNVKSSFFDSFYASFDDFIRFYRFLNVFDLDKIKKKISDNKNILINKLMHQSYDVLNSDLIRDTITVLELELGGDDQVRWVIQLGALRNFQKVLEIVNKLKMHNYPVYILSEDRVDDRGFIRIFVGPCSSKVYLESLLDDLYHLSMLRGKIYFYTDSLKSE